MSAQIISLEDIEAAERAANEPIEPDTFIPIIDVDPKTMAIAMRPRSWEQRRRFFDSIVAESLEKTMTLAEVLAGGEGDVQELEVMQTAHLGIHQAIGEMIECLGEETPTCKDSAAVFLCSMNPVHCTAARVYLNASGCEGAGNPPFMNREVFPDGNPLVMFLRMSVIMRPGLSEYWRKLKEQG